MLGDLQLSNGKRSSKLPVRNHAYLRKAWARFIAKVWLLHGNTWENKYYRISNLKVKINNPATSLAFF